MDDDNTLSNNANAEQKSELTSEPEWQRIASGQTIEQYCELGRRAVIRMRRGSRLDFYSWIEVIQVLWHFRTEHQLGGARYAEEAKKIGITEADAKRAKHLFEHLEKLVAWGELEAHADSVRSGLEEGKYPDLTKMCRRFPPPPSAQAQRQSAAKTQKDAQIEEGARNRSSASVRKELQELNDRMVAAKKISDDELAKERLLREITEGREAQMRMDRDAAEKARDEAIQRAEALATENAMLTAQIASMRSLPDSDDHIDIEKAPNDDDTAAGPDISETLPNPPEFTPEVEPGPVIHGLGGGYSDDGPIPFVAMPNRAARDPSEPYEPLAMIATDPDSPLVAGIIGLDVIAKFEQQNDLNGFSGRTGDGKTVALAREIRVLYYLTCIDHNIAVPSDLKQTRTAWAAREGKTTRQINAESGQSASSPDEPGEPDDP